MSCSNSASFIERGEYPTLNEHQYDKIRQFHSIPDFADALLDSEMLSNNVKEEFIDKILLHYLTNEEFKLNAQNKFVVFIANPLLKTYDLYDNLLNLTELDELKMRTKRVFTIYIGNQLCDTGYNVMELPCEGKINFV